MEFPELSSASRIKPVRAVAAAIATHDNAFVRTIGALLGANRRPEQKDSKAAQERLLSIMYLLKIVIKVRQAGGDQNTSWFSDPSGP